MKADSKFTKERKSDLKLSCVICHKCVSKWFNLYVLWSLWQLINFFLPFFGCFWIRSSDVVQLNRKFHLSTFPLQIFLVSSADTKLFFWCYKWNCLHWVSFFPLNSIICQHFNLVLKWLPGRKAYIVQHQDTF